MESQLGESYKQLIKASREYADTEMKHLIDSKPSKELVLASLEHTFPLDFSRNQMATIQYNIIDRALNSEYSYMSIEDLMITQGKATTDSLYPINVSNSITVEVPKLEQMIMSQLAKR
ncbi:hypothetical protein, partial [Vibrio anguillarum]